MDFLSRSLSAVTRKKIFRRATSSPDVRDEEISHKLNKANSECFLKDLPEYNMESNANSNLSALSLRWSGIHPIVRYSRNHEFMQVIFLSFKDDTKARINSVTLNHLDLSPYLLLPDPLGANFEWIAYKIELYDENGFLWKIQWTPGLQVRILVSQDVLITWRLEYDYDGHGRLVPLQSSDKIWEIVDTEEETGAADEDLTTPPEEEFTAPAEKDFTASPE